MFKRRVPPHSSCGGGTLAFKQEARGPDVQVRRVVVRPYLEAHNALLQGDALELQLKSTKDAHPRQSVILTSSIILFFVLFGDCKIE